MDIERIAELARGDSGLAMVSIARGDGSVQTSLVNAGVSSHPVDGRPVVAFVVQGSSHKVTILERTGRATVAWRNGWDWGSVEGSVELCGPNHDLAGFDPSALAELLRTVFRDAGGDHDDWDEYDRVMAAEHRTAVFVTPERFLGRS
jgi:hypothetical protein